MTKIKTSNIVWYQFRYLSEVVHYSKLFQMSSSTHVWPNTGRTNSSSLSPVQLTISWDDDTKLIILTNMMILRLVMIMMMMTAVRSEECSHGQWQCSDMSCVLRERVSWFFSFKICKTIIWSLWFVFIDSIPDFDIGLRFVG